MMETAGDQRGCEMVDTSTYTVVDLEIFEGGFRLRKFFNNCQGQISTLELQFQPSL